MKVGTNESKQATSLGWSGDSYSKIFGSSIYSVLKYTVISSLIVSPVLSSLSKVMEVREFYETMNPFG
jgi:hypothetical protein